MSLKCKKSKLETYVPEKRIELSKEDTLPILVNLGDKFSASGGVVGFFISSFFLSLKSFFNARKKIKNFMSKHERIVDLRRRFYNSVAIVRLCRYCQIRVI